MKIMPFIFFITLLQVPEAEVFCREKGETGSPALFSKPFIESRYKKNFITGNKKAEPDLFRVKAGTEALQISVYGKKKDGETSEFTSFKTGFFPFQDNRIMFNFFYGSIGFNGFASRMRNPPEKTTSVVYYPVIPTKSQFFSQGTASGKTNMAVDMLFGNWRVALYGDTKGCASSPSWASGGWTGKPVFLPSASLSVLFFGGKNILGKKTDDSWYHSYHRENESESLCAGSEISFKTKRFSASVMVSGTDGTLRPDGTMIRTDASLYGKHGRLSVFYSKTDRDYTALSGNRTKMLERAGFSPYIVFTFNRKKWTRFSAGSIFYKAMEKGVKEDSGDSESFYAGGYINAATLTSGGTFKLKKDMDSIRRNRLQIESSFKSAALMSRRLVFEVSTKTVFTGGNKIPEQNKTTGSVTFRSTIYRSIGIGAERLSEKGTSYTVSAFFTERISAGRLKTDLSCKISAHTDERKFSGNITVKTLLK